MEANELEKLRAENIELRNYILKLERELQTGDLNGQRHNITGNQRPQDPAG